MRIGIDIDDTICDTWDYLMPHLSKHFGVSINELKNIKGTYYEACKCTLDQYCAFSKKYYSKFCMEFKLKENVFRVINELKKNGHQIIFITARSNKGFDDPYKNSYDYLNAHNLPFDKLIVNAKDKAEICHNEKIDLFIDDDISNCESVYNKGINVLIFNNSYNKNISNLKRIYDWNEVHLEIERLVKYGR